MAKRASLKDKGPETLGLTLKKGRGIDVLFGGPMGNQAAVESTSTADAKLTTNQAAVEETPMTNDTNDLSGLLADTPAQPAPPPVAAFPPTMESLPVNEADDDNISEDVVDELGLPVAMDAPPPDLQLAATPVAEAAPKPAAPVAPPALPVMPVARPALPSSPPTMPVAMPAAPPSPPVAMPAAAPLAPAVWPAAGMPLGEADESGDLSGLAAEDDLSGLATEAPAATIPPANLPPGMLLSSSRTMVEITSLSSTWPILGLITRVRWV